MSKRPHSPPARTTSGKRQATEAKSRIHTLPLYSNEHYLKSCPSYAQPYEITSYSIDGNRRVWFDNREIKYYCQPRAAALSSGFDTFIKRDDSVSEHLDTLLDALTTVQQKEIHDPKLTTADIVTWRGIMTKILCTPYSRREPWELRATKFKGTIFIEEQPTAEKLQREETLSTRDQLMSYWGYRFESYCTSRSEADTPRIDEPVNSNEQYCVVVKTKLGKTSLIMGAEVDCIQGKKTKNPLSQYIELKTSRRIETGGQRHTFERFKLLKFWAQSFLIGVPRVVCGFRDNDGNIGQSDVQTFNTMEIPRRVRGTPSLWDASVCLNFADQFLTWLRRVIDVDDPTTTYTILWQKPWREITVQFAGKSNTFLTQRFLDGQVSNTIGGQRADILQRQSEPI